MASKAHPGFAAVQNKIEGEGYSKEAAGAILAKKTRAASRAAKAANPRLKRVKTKAKKGGGGQVGKIMSKMMAD